MELTTLHLTTDEAASFLRFRQYEKEFNLLVKSGVFGVQNGSAELHFDAVGNLSSIDLHFRVFRAPKPQIIVAEVVDTIKVKV